MHRRINFFKDYLIERFGHPLYRIPINLALGCPHKTNKSSGCIFCSENGARAVHLKRRLNIKEQINEGVKYIHKRYDNSAYEYIAYLQAYTNTYADIERLKKIYEEILGLANFKLMIVATRPDCLSSDTLEYFSKLNERVELWVEIGIQTANDITLTKINRKHDFYTAEKAVITLQKLGIKNVAHIIIGLPDETLSDYIDTVRKISNLPFTGIKIHNLLVLKNSELGNLYKKTSKVENSCVVVDGIGKIPLLNEYEYIDILTTLIRLIPPNIAILRVTADAPKEEILSPKWNFTKGRILELLQHTFKENGYMQGDLVGQQLNTLDCTALAKSSLKIKTEDGSFTFYNYAYKECYHSQSGARSEAYHKFIVPSEIALRLKKKSMLSILDIGFGLGYNAIAGLKEVMKYNGAVNITSLELDIKSLYLALSIYKTNSFEHNIIKSLMHSKRWTDDQNSIELLIGDARKLVTLLRESFDLIFLDAFSTNKNPELWTYDFIIALRKILQQNGAIVTYSAAFPIRGAMLRSKLYIGTTHPFGRKTGGTLGSPDATIIKIPLSEKDLKIILKSTAGVPYRDPTLSSTSKNIIEHRVRIVKKLRTKGLPKWV